MGRGRIVRGLIPVLSVAGLGCADIAWAEAESRAAEVALEAGEIDSRTLAAGARAVVVHGRGERHPVSGEWSRLDTSAGYVQAIDAETLVLAREGDLRQERIPLDRIERVVIGGPREEQGETEPLEIAGRAEIADSGRVVPRRTYAIVERREERGARVFRKVGAGALGGVVGGFAGVVAGVTWVEECAQGDTFCALDKVVDALLLGTSAYTVGVAVGVSRADPHDRFLSALAGSAAGLVPGIYLTRAEGILWPTLLAGPIITATMMSEWFRAPPEDGGLSIRLSPTHGRGFSASAALRF